LLRIAEIVFRAVRSKIAAMNATPVWSVRRVAAWLALALLVASAQSAAQEDVAAVWKERKVSFTYGSSIAIYSCSALEGRVASILRAVGARDDLQVKASMCSESIAPLDARIGTRGSTNAADPLSARFVDRRTDVDQSADVFVRLMMPVEVTTEVLAELKKDKSRRELVSRATGNPAAKFNDPVLFTAQWQTVTLSRKTIGLEPEECELLDQMSGSVFRQLDVRVVRRGYTCDPYRVSRIPPELTVEALLGTPFVTGSAQPTPAAGEGDADPGAPAASDDDPAEPATDKTPE
jgi:hypothetical protein